MAIENRIRAFVRSESSGAIVLQGTWGRGKTHLWKKLIDEYLSDSSVPKKRKYAYVSLFGINNLDALKVAIFQARDEFNERQTDASKSDVSNWRKLIPWTNNEMSKGGKEAMVIASGSISSGLFAKAFNALSYYSVKEMIICLDDLERRGNDLRLLDVMGLISQLWEQRKCHVVAILNNQSLGEEQVIWDENREKVFQGELTFSPSSSQCVSLVFEEDTQSMDYVYAREALIELKVTNIRIIERVRWAIDLVFGYTEDIALSPETRKHIVRALVLLVFSHSGSAEEGSPSFQRVMRWSKNSEIAVVMPSSKERTADEIKIDDLLSAYGLHMEHSLDHCLSKIVTHGYPDIEELKKQLQTYEAEADIRARNEAFHFSWQLFSLNYQNNREQILNSFRHTVPNAASSISANNMDATLKLVRAMGENELATQFINSWISHRQGVRANELDPEKINQFGPVQDAELLNSINETYLRHRQLPSLYDAMMAFGTNTGWDHLTVEAVAASDVTEIVSFLLETNVGWLSAAVKKCLQLGPDNGNYRNSLAISNMREALLQIAKQSELQRVKIEWTHRF